MYRYLASQPETNKYLRKAADVNRYLKGRSREKKSPLHKPWKHYNGNASKHIKTSLIKRGTQVSSSQFAEAIFNIIH